MYLHNLHLTVGSLYSLCQVPSSQVGFLLHPSLAGSHSSFLFHIFTSSSVVNTRTQFLSKRAKLNR